MPQKPPKETLLFRPLSGAKQEKYKESPEEAKIQNQSDADQIPRSLHAAAVSTNLAVGAYVAAVGATIINSHHERAKKEKQESTHVQKNDMPPQHIFKENDKPNALLSNPEIIPLDNTNKKQNPHAK